jgi:hypothetical protein
MVLLDRNKFLGKGRGCNTDRSTDISATVFWIKDECYITTEQQALVFCIQHTLLQRESFHHELIYTRENKCEYCYQVCTPKDDIVNVETCRDNYEFKMI